MSPSGAVQEARRTRSPIATQITFKVTDGHAPTKKPPIASIEPPAMFDALNARDSPGQRPLDVIT